MSTSSVFRAIGALCSALLVVGCGGGGGGGGGGSSVEWYYHFACNGDPECLSTNFANAPSGTSYQGPDAAGRAGCDSLLEFGRRFWNIPPAQQWCDNTAAFNVPPTPSVSLTLSPTTIDATQSSTLSWTSTLVTSCTANGAWSGARATSGSITVTPGSPGNYTYSLNCTGAEGNASASATLTVTTPPPQVNLDVSPATITLGQSATLTWTSWQFTLCTASGPWSGSRALNGNEVVTPAAAGSYTYTLSCQSASKGFASDSVTVTVNPVSGPAPPAAPAVTVGAAIEFPSCVDTGGGTTLTWSSSNATACTASGAWGGDVALAGSKQIYPGAANSNAYSSYEYVLNCSGPGGTSSDAVTICATPTNGTPPPQPTLDFTVTPASISLGESAVLEWSSRYAGSCTASADWSGLKPLEGKLTVVPTQTRGHSYTLVCQAYHGSVTVTVNLGVQVPSGNDPQAARFGNIEGLSIDASDTIYISDTSNDTIRKITAAGNVSSIAGQVSASEYKDGVGASAHFTSPVGLDVGPDGKVLVADYNSDAIRSIAPDTTVTTLAGYPGYLGEPPDYQGDGTGAGASIYRPTDTAVDPDGNVYVANYGYYTVRKITPEGVVTTLAGFNRTSGSADGNGSAARFNSPAGIVLANGALYVTDVGNHTIRRITLTGDVTTFAGTPGVSGAVDGTGSAAQFNWPWGIGADSAGNLYVSEKEGRKVRKITPAGVVTTLAGSGAFGGADGTGAAATFRYPLAVDVDSAGNVYIGDVCTIRKITQAGVVTTFAGKDLECGSNN